VVGRSAECEAALKRYGLERSSMAIIGADRPPLRWRAGITPTMKIVTCTPMARPLVALLMVLAEQRVSPSVPKQVGVRVLLLARWLGSPAVQGV
jgi:hypothetical protein